MPTTTEDAAHESDVPRQRLGDRFVFYLVRLLGWTRRLLRWCKRGLKGGGSDDQQKYRPARLPSL